jgi:RNA polymerase sigma-54 factor
LLFKLNINISETELLPLLKIVQKLDPIGIGARDLQECLLLQLEAKQASDTINLAKAILTKQYTAFVNKNYEKLIREFEVDENQLKEAYKEVEQLNPKPGASFTNIQEGNSYITPDFILEEENDELSATLSNSKNKKLRSSQYYKKMLQDLEQGKGDKDAILFLKDKIEGAEWFANALIQREQTLLKTMNCILKIQEDFFKTGDNKMLKPMKLMDISEKIGLDISTISRVTNSKYIETPYGTFLLKEFFSDAYSKEDGTVISNKVIKSHLEDILENEDKKKPYSDEELSEKLDEIGFHIARRTVAKYRDQLGVAVAKLRREL